MAFILFLMMTSDPNDMSNDTKKADPVRQNRLAGSTSPYLLQHKDNPVNWYPWGPEALAASRSEDKPIFLSIGYSACHWCHVMEEESFTDAETAAVMARYFISIKVDREERPDLDDIYMTAVQMLTGSGGWPMSVWLTPDLKPFYGGTYFPNQSRYGRPSFKQVLTALGEGWAKDRVALISQADKIHDSVVEHMSGRGRAGSGPPTEPGALGADLITRAISDMTHSFDSVNGGFGIAPKFPPHRGLALLLSRYRQTRDQNLLRMATLTFDSMARGGMYDQIGGGFHRYSTDPQWLVPHFEKMLYDNALLADAYLDAWQTTGDDSYQRIVREICDWVLREMVDAEGGFHSTLDADSEGEEGRFYVWKPDEVISLLGPADGALIDDFYGITPRGNFEGGASIPHVETPAAAFAERSKLPLAEFLYRLHASRRTLLAARAGRVRPHLDDKVLTAWNGMMIAALARCGHALDENRYLSAARKAADSLLTTLRGADGLMRVSYRKGQVNSEGFLDDQAFFIAGLIALNEATGEPRWLAEAQSLVKETDAAYWDQAKGGYFFTPPGRSDLIVRAKNPTDGAIPSGNSVMAAALLRLHRLTGDVAYRKHAAEIFASFEGAMTAAPGAFQNMLSALGQYMETGPAAPHSPLVAVKTRAGSLRTSAEGMAVVDLDVEIKEGWHINSSTPSLPYLIATTVMVPTGQAASVHKVEYPPGREVSLGFAGKPISVYEGRLVLTVTMKAAAGSVAGGVSIVRGAVTYQACNDTSCMPPSQSVFEIPIQLDASTSPG